MTLVTVLVLVAVLAPIALLALAPSVPARRNPFPGRRSGATHRRPTTAQLSATPGQHGSKHHAR
ncbi:hypothetical protein P8A22_14660 [Streptomyces laculatispora]|uniref:Secreted protein n=1 Tax=Streptomyces laculatispora TaxID=887464 RepID=A0ABY9I2N2_9ACTN|nr:hypothetical protein [Streptomyces laculatispora]WLQ41120.1 hypothetical protein P8A22_14660 [Streptomyces laculatispora]